MDSRRLSGRGSIGHLSHPPCKIPRKKSGLVFRVLAETACGRLPVTLVMALALVGTPVVLAAGQYGLSFDGANDYVNITDDASLNPGTGGLTITFWVKLDSTPGAIGTTFWDVIVGKRSVNTKGYYVGANRDQCGAGQAGMNFMLGDTSGNRVDTKDSSYLCFDYDEWTFFAAVLDRTNNQMKISKNADGSWIAVTPPAGSIAPQNDLSIGTDIGENDYWVHGLVDEVRIWNTARTQQQIQDNMNSEIESGSGLVARWGFNEGTGASAADSAGGNDGSVTGATWVTGHALDPPGPDETNPTISTLSPADNATDIAVDANLVLGFSEAVVTGTGNVTIKRTSDDATVEAIDVTSDQVTGSGTDTITVNPSVTLGGSTGYYVLVAATAFDDTAGNSYAGIADTTTWNFTTANPSPDAPTLNSPSNGATGVSLPPTLDVAVSDPDGESMTVTFHGREYYTPEDDFTVVTLPDTQNYSTSYAATFAAQTQWIADNVNALNIQMVLHEGDVVNDGDSDAEWANAAAALATLDSNDIPNLISIGNHDYDDQATTRGDTFFNNNIDYSSWYANKDWFDGGAYEVGKSNNVYTKVQIGDLKYLFMTLEFGPRQSVIDWANGII